MPMDDEEQLLREQERFLASRRPAAARVVSATTRTMNIANSDERLPLSKRDVVSLGEMHSASPRAGPDEASDEEAPPPPPPRAPVLGAVRETVPPRLKVSLFKQQIDTKNKAIAGGFPKALHRSQGGNMLGQKAGWSSPAALAPAPVVPQPVDRIAQGGVGSGGGGSGSITSEIHEQNLEVLASMSRSEIVAQVRIRRGVGLHCNLFTKRVDFMIE